MSTSIPSYFLFVGERSDKVRRPRCFNRCFMCRIIVVDVLVAVVAALMRGPVASRASVAKAGLRAFGNLADDSDENNRLLGAAGACEGA